MKKSEFIVGGMTCSACAATIERTVGKLAGVSAVNVNLLSATMVVEFDEKVISPQKIEDAVRSVGYTAQSREVAKENESGTAFKWTKTWQAQRAEQKALKLRLIASVVLLLPLLYIAMGPMIGLPSLWFFEGANNAAILALAQLIFATIIIFINKKFFVSGFRAVLHRAPNMDTLVALGSGASYIFSLAVTFAICFKLGQGDLEGVHALCHSLYFESSATILTLVTLGKFFESISKTKTSSALEKLVKLTPQTAKVLRNGEEVEVLTKEIVVGDIVVIRSGDVVPVDGEVTDGEGLLNQAAVTGESVPVKKSAGEAVISASICENGSFKFRATKVGEDTSLAQIIRMVDETSSSKAPIARIADKVSGYFVPVVIVIALITFVAWLIAGYSVAHALTSAVSVLVISCPCALGLATPTAIMVATGKSASLGVLVRSAESLEQLQNVGVVVVDKTGTLTCGSFEVTDVRVMVQDQSEKDVLLKLAALEENSNHPIALAITKNAKKLGFVPNSGIKIKKFKEILGKGIVAELNGEKLLAGNLKLIEEQIKLSGSEKSQIDAILSELSEQGKTPIIFAANDKVQAVLAVADKIKEDSREAVASLKSLGLKVVMLTGDNEVVARAVAARLGIDEVVANVLPEQKQQIVSKFKAQGKPVAMVGDGINDSPALAAADVGVAVSTGTDIAIETADVVLSGGSLKGLFTAIELSRATITNIKINLFWAFIYNILAIPLACGLLYVIAGWQLSPMIASLAMSLSSVCVVTSALTLNLFKPKPVKIDGVQNSEIKIDDIQNSENKEEKTMTKIIHVEGMMCNHCKMHVSEALAKLGAKNVDVDLENKTAKVECGAELSDEKIVKAIEDAGYSVSKIEEQK